MNERIENERFDRRYPASLDVVVTGLADPPQIGLGHMTDVSKAGLSVLISVGFAPHALVKVDFADSTLFGYIVHSNPHEGGFRTGIEIERVLLGGTDLSRLLASLLAEEMPHVLGVNAVPAAKRNPPGADR
jgi:hypothetical protein